MSQPFDATMKDILALAPEAWPRLLGYPATEAKVINADIATISGAADYVIRVKGKPDWLHHVDFQAGTDAKKPRKLNVYNSVLEDRHECQVRSSLMLLRPQANLKAYSGRYECRFANEAEPYRTFRYDVVRLWELDPEPFLTGSINLIPLVPLTKVTPEAMPDVLGTMKERIDEQADPTGFRVLWSATDILMRLRFENEFITQLIQKVLPMEHSTWFLSLEKNGQVRGVRETILNLAQTRFGTPSEPIRQTLEAISDLDQLNETAMRILTAESWEELVQVPKKKPAKRKTAR